MTKAHSQTGPKGITDDQIKRSLRMSQGVISYAAKNLKCSPWSLRKRIANNSELLEFSKSLEEDVLDKAEMVIRLALKAKDATTARWLLDRKGKSRGYKQTTEISGLNGGAIQHAVTAEVMEPVTAEEIAAARSRFIDNSDD